MAKRVMQIRYYGNTNSNNQPSVLKEDLRTNKEHPLINGEVFDKYKPITQLGIQTLPGTRVYLNNNEEFPVIIGSTGIYELELEGISSITNLHFDSALLNAINSGSNGFLIVDIVYEA